MTHKFKYLYTYFFFTVGILTYFGACFITNIDVDNWLSVSATSLLVFILCYFVEKDSK